MTDDVDINDLLPERDRFVLWATWDRERNALSVGVQTATGQRYVVRIPVERISWHVDQELAAVGCYEPPLVGDLPTVEGLFKRVRRAAKKFGKRVKRAAKSTGKRLARVANKITHSPITKALAGASALAMPAIGGPALAALAGANRLRAIKQRAAKGDKRAQQMLGVARQQAARLAQSNTPQARIALRALQTLR